MSKQPVKYTWDSALNKYEDSVTGVRMWDCGPDDAVFTKAYVAPIRAATSPKMKTRSPLKLLRDYSTAWAEYGVSCPDLVFQTAAQGLYFYHHCLSDTGTPATSGPPDVVDGMCIARVVGVNLIWPEK